MPWAHFDAPEVHIDAQRLKRRPHMIVHADRRPAGNQQHVEQQPASQKLCELFRIVAGDAEQHRLDTQRLRLRHQRVTVRVGDLVGVERLVEAFEFVAGGQNGHTRPAVDRHLSAFDRRQNADHARRNFGPCAQHHLPVAHRFAEPANVIAGFDRATDFNPAIGQLLRVLDPDHGIGTDRHRRSGHDARTLAGEHRSRRPVAGLDVFDDGQGVWRAAEIGTAQRKTIHRRNIEGRLIAVGTNLFGQHPPQRVFEIDDLAIQGRHMLQNAVLRVPDRQMICFFQGITFPDAVYVE